MRIIKCDICKKEIDPKEVIYQYSLGNELELCTNCNKKFVENSQIFNEELSKLDNEYRDKRNKLYENLVLKNINK